MGSEESPDSAADSQSMHSAAGVGVRGVRGLPRGPGVHGVRVAVWSLRNARLPRSPECPEESGRRQNPGISRVRSAMAGTRSDLGRKRRFSPP